MRKILALVLIAITVQVNAQSQQDRAQDLQLNSIVTAVPFLNSTPDSRGGALGDVGVSTSADAYSTHWNPAKHAFQESQAGFAFSYIPWLRALVNDMNMAYLTGYAKVNKISTVSLGFRYFSLGNITFTTETGDVIRDFKPSEFALDGAYSIKLSDRLSSGVALRYIYSNLTGGSTVAGASTKPGQSVAFDFGMFYKTKDFKLGSKKGQMNWGLNLSNIGNKMTYTNNLDEDFLPSNLRFGQTFTILLDEYNSIGITTEMNKLLVPTPNGRLDTSEAKVSPAQGVFGSFNDAPSDGEELQEINLSGGLEYLYNKQLAFRMGYFYEAPNKGNRQYITLGAGFRYQVLNIDLSYLLSTTQQNPLANTLRFSLSVDLGKKKDNTKNSGAVETYSN